MEQTGQSFDEERLANSRYTFKERMPTAEQRNDAVILKLVLSDYYSAHFIAYVR